MNLMSKAGDIMKKRNMYKGLLKNKKRKLQVIIHYGKRRKNIKKVKRKQQIDIIKLVSKFT